MFGSKTCVDFVDDIVALAYLDQIFRAIGRAIVSAEHNDSIGNTSFTSFIASGNIYISFSAISCDSRILRVSLGFIYLSIVLCTMALKTS